MIRVRKRPMANHYGEMKARASTERPPPSIVYARGHSHWLPSEHDSRAEPTRSAHGTPRKEVAVCQSRRPNDVNRDMRWSLAGDVVHLYNTKVAETLHLFAPLFRMIEKTDSSVDQRFMTMLMTLS